MTLKELRKQKKLTQAECAKYLGIPLRTYQNYEKDEAKASSMKYAFMMQKLQEYKMITKNVFIASGKRNIDEAILWGKGVTEFVHNM